MYLIFIRPTECLVMTYRDLMGHIRVREFDAANIVDSGSKGEWPDGVYQAEKLIPITGEAGEDDGSYGPYFLRFADFQERQGMGIHGGRGSYRHPTMGCIRTKNKAIVEIAKWWYLDQAAELVVTSRDTLGHKRGGGVDHGS